MTDTASKKVQDLNEVELYLLIEECGGFCWRMNHDMQHGRIPESEHAAIDKEITRIQQYQITAIKELPRIGIAKPLDDTEHGTPEYWVWYRKWNQWHHNMPEESWRTVNASITKGITDEQVEQYRQESDAMAVATKAAAEEVELRNLTGEATASSVLAVKE